MEDKIVISLEGFGGGLERKSRIRFYVPWIYFTVKSYLDNYSFNLKIYELGKTLFLNSRSLGNEQLSR